MGNRASKVHTLAGALQAGLGRPVNMSEDAKCISIFDSYTVCRFHAASAFGWRIYASNSGFGAIGNKAMDKGERQLQQLAVFVHGILVAFHTAGDCV